MNEELTDLLSEAARRTFQDVVEEHGRHDIIGFAFYSSDGLPFVSFACATRAALTATEPDSSDYFRFVTDEWNVMSDTNHEAASNDLIGSLYACGRRNEEADPDWHSDHVKTVAESCIDALHRLVDDGTFGENPGRNHLFLMLGVSDSLMSFEEGVAWSGRLNTASVHERYAAFASAVVARGSY